MLSGGALLLAACGRRNEDPIVPGGPATKPAAVRPPAPDLGSEMFPNPAGKPIAAPSDAPVIMLPRTAWTKSKPDLTHIELMGQVERITVHHTGMKSYKSTAYNITVEDIVGIRDFHTTDKDRKWADIAYHFVVDPAGRVWQGRPLVYQGSHALLQNAHNMGIVLMGNFEVQTPTAVQLNSLAAFVGFVRGIYKIPVAKVFTHGELRQTECPGKYLQAYMNRARADWART